MIHPLLATVTDTAYGRALIGDSLGFHIIFAALGVGLPLLICLAELLGIVGRKPLWIATARRWTEIQVVLFVAGAVSGTIISIQLGLVWPVFMKIAGQVMGAAFSLEGIGFFIEAVFLGIYTLTWDRLSPWRHWLLSVLVVIGATLSAFFITSANAFMNAPQGFTYLNGKVSNIHPWTAMFNPATLTETTHSIVAYWIMSAGLVATWYAWRLWRGQGGAHQRQVLAVLAGVVLVCSGLLGFTGDASAKYLARHEPIKLAAAESLFNTTAGAPLRIGGIVRGDSLHGAITIPGLLSWLAFGSSRAVVIGLHDVAPAMWPPLTIHYFFDGMVGIGILLVLAPVAFLALWWRQRSAAYRRWGLALMWLTGPLAFMAVELGWMLTEIGRQPYAIRGILTTQQALTTSPAVIHAAAIFPTLYLVLFGVTAYVVFRLRPRRTTTTAPSKPAPPKSTPAQSKPKVL